MMSERNSMETDITCKESPYVGLQKRGSCISSMEQETWDEQVQIGQKEDATTC